MPQNVKKSAKFSGLVIS